MQELVEEILLHQEEITQEKRIVSDVAGDGGRKTFPFFIDVGQEQAKKEDRQKSERRSVKEGEKHSGHKSRRNGRVLFAESRIEKSPEEYLFQHRPYHHCKQGG